MNSGFLSSAAHFKENGTLYALGSNSSGQLGIGNCIDKSVACTTFRSQGFPDYDMGPKFPHPKQITSGGNHTLLLDYRDRLWTTGRNNENQCMLAEAPKVSLTVAEKEIDERSEDKLPESHIFRFIPDDNFLTPCVAATWTASFVLKQRLEGDTRTTVAVVGSGTQGELGINPYTTSSPHPRLIYDLPPHVEIKQITACVHHVVALMMDGSVWGWGNGRKGQLGEPAEMVHKPRRLVLDVDFRVSYVTCGKDFTFLASEPRDGRYKILGPKRWQEPYYGPQTIKSWKQIHTSWGGIYVLYKDGSMNTWGRNDHGQLAPVDIPPILTMAVGSEHVLALTLEDPHTGRPGGQLISWGWGEHGNCGLKSEGGEGPYHYGVNKDWNIIDVPWLNEKTAKGAFLGAGCATSFVWVPESDTTVEKIVGGVKEVGHALNPLNALHHGQDQGDPEEDEYALSEETLSAPGRSGRTWSTAFEVSPTPQANGSFG